MIVLPMFVMTLVIKYDIKSGWDIICVSYILEEAVRYVITYLVINTMSR